MKHKEAKKKVAESNICWLVFEIHADFLVPGSLEKDQMNIGQKILKYSIVLLVTFKITFNATIL